MLKRLRASALLIGLGALFLVPLSRAQEDVDLSPPVFGEFDPAQASEINPNDYPVLPELTAHAAVIYERAIESGRDPRMFSKVGDSITASEHFLVGFGTGEYDLGSYSALQPVIDYFLEGVADSAETPFNRENLATDLGFSTTSALDPTWTRSELCRPNETPLTCEYRVSQSAWALVMFGTNDVMVLDEMLFDYFFRTVILETIDQDVVPILHTFPERPEEPEKSFRFNQIIIQAALDYDLPLVNLAKALEDLEHKGVDPDDPLHLTVPENPADVTVFNAAALEAGYTVRNLVTLQALDLLLREVGALE